MGVGVSVCVCMCVYSVQGDKVVDRFGPSVLHQVPPPVFSRVRVRQI